MKIKSKGGIIRTITFIDYSAPVVSLMYELDNYYSNSFIYDNHTEFEILTNPDGSPWKEPKREFKVGDRICLANYSSYGRLTGTIKRIENGEAYCEDWDKGCSVGSLNLENYPFELLPEEPVKKEHPQNNLEKLNQSQKIYNLGEQPKKGFIMSVVEKLKEFALSETDRVLRKNDLEDEHGEMTSEATTMMMDEIVAERWKTRRADIAAKLIEMEKK